MVIKLNKGTFIRLNSIVQYEIQQSGSIYILNALLSSGSPIKITESSFYNILYQCIESLESLKLEKQKDVIVDINDILKL